MEANDFNDETKVFEGLELLNGVKIVGKYQLKRAYVGNVGDYAELCFWDEEKGSLVPFSSVAQAI